MEKNERTIEIHCFKTNRDDLKIKLRCQYRYFRDDVFAYCITATPFIKNLYTGVLCAERRYERQEMYATTTRYNKYDLQRFSAQIKKAADDFEQNVYNDSPAAYYLGLVLDVVLRTTKQHAFPTAAEPLRITTQSDRKPKKCRTQKFKCSVPK